MSVPRDLPLLGVNAGYRRALAASVGEELAASLDVSRPELWVQALLEPVLERQARRDDAAVLSGALPQTWRRPHLQIELPAPWPPPDAASGPERLWTSLTVKIVSSDVDLRLTCLPLPSGGPWVWDGLFRFHDLQQGLRVTSNVQHVCREVDALHDLAVQAGMAIHAERKRRGPFSARLDSLVPEPTALQYLEPPLPAFGEPSPPPVNPADPYCLFPWLLEPALLDHPDARLDLPQGRELDDAFYWTLRAPGRGKLFIDFENVADFGSRPGRYSWGGLSLVTRSVDGSSCQQLWPDEVLSAVHLWLAGPPWADA